MATSKHRAPSSSRTPSVTFLEMHKLRSEVAGLRGELAQRQAHYDQVSNAQAARLELAMQIIRTHVHHHPKPTEAGIILAWATPDVRISQVDIDQCHQVLLTAWAELQAQRQLSWSVQMSEQLSAAWALVAKGIEERDGITAIGDPAVVEVVEPTENAAA